MADDDIDAVVAQLAVMCPDQNVAFLSTIVNQVKNSGLDAGNRELMFNICLDRVFGNNPDLYGAPPVAPLHPTPVLGQITNIPAPNGKADGGPPPPKRRKGDEAQTSAQSGSNLEISISNVVTNNASQQQQPSGSSSSPSTTEQAESSTKMPVMEIDPNKQVTSAEVIHYVNHVKEMFPLVEKQWLTNEFERGISLTLIVEQIVNRPGDVPKEKKPIKKPEHKFKQTKNYFDIGEKPNSPYIDTGRKMLLNEFRQISSKSLISVFTYFNFHYAPTIRAIRNTLKNVNIRSYHNSFVPLENDPSAQLVLHINKSRRNQRNLYQEIPDDLKCEIEWMNEHIYEMETPTTNVSPNEQGSVNSSSILQDLERERILQEARDKGEVYECVICCDEFLIGEMIPCLDGHLFCPECLKNHAREIVYGQAKALITCLEADCKATFARDALQKALDIDWLTKLDERNLEENVNCADIDGLVKCKYCNYAVVMDVPFEQNKVFKCANPQCEREVCRSCGVDWEEHIGLRCNELENNDETKLRRDAEEKMADAVIRKCQKCNAQLMKIDGCNKMTCRCGAKMCYICRKPNIDYNHFCNHVRTPGKTCDKCTACSLWEDAEKLDKVTVEKIKKDAEVAQEALGTGQMRHIGVDDTKFSNQVPKTNHQEMNFDAALAQIRNHQQHVRYQQQRPRAP